MTDKTEKRTQVVKQCEAVAHLARAVAEIYDDYAKIFQDKGAEPLVDQVGDRTAAFMESLGGMLNATDAATEDDRWLNSVFAGAHRIFPQSTLDVVAKNTPA